MAEQIKKFFVRNWLLCLIAVQPVLDALAYWTQNSTATAAGYIRLLIMVILPLYLLITLKKKRGFILSMAVIGLFCVLHVLNGLRVGYINMFFDVAYLARVIQTPVLGICFIYFIRDEKTKGQAMKGILTAAVITLVLLIVAFVTGTWNSTYGGKVGLSGWVIDDNRCANSILMVTFSVFAVGAAACSNKKIVNILIPVLAALVLILNGTKACYLGMFAIMAGYGVFMLLRRVITGERVKKLFLLTVALVIVAGVVVYPITPRAKVDNAQAASAVKSQNELNLKLQELGYDVNAMTLEEKLADPVLRELFEDYYYRMIAYVIPDMFERFGVEKVLIKYNMTTSAERLIDVRVMKTTYASLIWDECDTLTKLVGFETTNACGDGTYDMENDWPALFYYYGYVGFGLYVAFILYFIFLILRRLIRDFKGSLTMDNFALLLCFALQLGLAQFSGAILRRPNVSFYLALVLALIYYKTVRFPIGSVKDATETVE